MAGKYNISIEQGATFELQLKWKNAAGIIMDLTGYTARMQLRNKLTDAVVLDLTTENGRIAINGDVGSHTIDLEIDATDTAALSLDKCKYDLEMVSSDGKVYRMLEGAVSISAEVTR